MVEIDVLKVNAEAGLQAHDVAAAEEPLEIRLGVHAFVMIMRTPGADQDLATGFLLSEQIVRTAGDRNVAQLEQLCDTMLHGSLCGLGGLTPYPVESVLKHFRQDFYRGAGGPGIRRP